MLTLLGVSVFTFKILAFMRAKLLILLCFLTFSIGKAQIGIQGHYYSMSSQGEQSQVFNSFTGGVDYWFRMDRVRLEFRPFLGFESLQSRETDIGMQSLSFEFQTLFYPMDWFNDCQCPTFGKSNDFVKKGFFFTVAPYVGRLLNDPENWEQSSDWAWGLKAGAGLDIGLSDYVTITPFARMMYVVDHFTQTVASNKNGQLGFQVGLILGLRWDEQNF